MRRFLCFRRARLVELNGVELAARKPFMTDVFNGAEKTDDLLPLSGARRRYRYAKMCHSGRLCAESYGINAGSDKCAVLACPRQIQLTTWLVPRRY